MKIIFIVSLSLCITACIGPRFSTVTDCYVPKPCKLDSIQVDSTYELYLRQVVKHFDPLTHTFKLVNDYSSESDSIIEREFMFVSMKDSNVLVVNNVPDIYQNITGKENGFDLFNRGDTVNIDIWYFRQFRFGKLLAADRFLFIPTDDPLNGHTWNFKNNVAGTLKLKSISYGDSAEDRVRYVTPAFAIEVIYKKVKSYNLVFVSKDGDFNPIETFRLPENRLYLYHKKKKKWMVYFKFGKPINEIGNNIRFKRRLYAAPVNLIKPKQ